MFASALGSGSLPALGYSPGASRAQGGVFIDLCEFAHSRNASGQVAAAWHPISRSFSWAWSAHVVGISLVFLGLLGGQVVQRCGLCMFAFVFVIRLVFASPAAFVVVAVARVQGSCWFDGGVGPPGRYALCACEGSNGFEPDGSGKEVPDFTRRKNRDSEVQNSPKEIGGSTCWRGMGIKLSGVHDGAQDCQRAAITASPPYSLFSMRRGSAKLLVEDERHEPTPSADDGGKSIATRSRCDASDVT
nr:hypothetical protein Iba_chr12eCG5290 [Ipomoea batatas]